MNNLIKQYINKITINNINDFALKNNINLDENELNILYDVTKNNYEEILNGNISQIQTHLKKNLKEENYHKVIKLYDVYKQKYNNYL